MPPETKIKQIEAGMNYALVLMGNMLLILILTIRLR